MSTFDPNVDYREEKKNDDLCSKVEEMQRLWHELNAMMKDDRKNESDGGEKKKKTEKLSDEEVRQIIEKFMNEPIDETAPVDPDEAGEDPTIYDEIFER